MRRAVSAGIPLFANVCPNLPDVRSYLALPFSKMVNTCRTKDSFRPVIMDDIVYSQKKVTICVMLHVTLSSLFIFPHC